MKTTNEDIYILYKHGANLNKYPMFNCKKIYNALKEYGLQVVLVNDKAGRNIVYNFIPETGRFVRIFYDL